jgi:hypothetical protein
MRFKNSMQRKRVMYLLQFRRKTGNTYSKTNTYAYKTKKDRDAVVKVLKSQYKYGVRYKVNKK